MILLLLFLTSSTLPSRNAQKPKPKIRLCACADFFYGAQAKRNAAVTEIAVFWATLMFNVHMYVLLAMYLYLAYTTHSLLRNTVKWVDTKKKYT